MNHIVTEYIFLNEQYTQLQKTEISNSNNNERRTSIV